MIASRAVKEILRSPKYEKWVQSILLLIIVFLYFQEYKTDLFNFVIFQARVGITVIEFILHFFAEKPITSVHDNKVRMIGWLIGWLIDLLDCNRQPAAIYTIFEGIV